VTRRPGLRTRPERAGKTTLLRIVGGWRRRYRRGETGARPRTRVLRQEHETLDHDRTVLENICARPRRRADDTELRRILGAFLFSGEAVEHASRNAVGGEKTRLALASLVCSSANVLLLDEPTNNLDPARGSRCWTRYGRSPARLCWSPMTRARSRQLAPDRVILLPDGIEDTWSADFADLIALA